MCISKRIIRILILWMIISFRRLTLSTILIFIDTQSPIYFFFFFNDRAPPEIYPLPLHAALPICARHLERDVGGRAEAVDAEPAAGRRFAPLEGPVPDDARAEERRGVGVAEGHRDPIEIGRAHV